MTGIGLRGAARLVVWLTALGVLSACVAQSRSATPFDTTALRPDIFLLSNQDGNLIALVGRDSSLVVGPQVPSLVRAAHAMLQGRHAGPVRFVVVTAVDSAPVYADGGWGREGAIVVAHETLRSIMRRARSSSVHELPAVGFSEVVQLYLNGHSVHVIHHRSGYSSADVIVHFEDAGVVYLDNTFTSNGYPEINVARGGSINDMITTIQSFLDAPESWRFVPGRGPITGVADLHAYHDMLVSVRDTVQRLIDHGTSERDVIAAKPTAAFDHQWGRGPVGADQFVGMIYESLPKSQTH